MVLVIDGSSEIGAHTCGLSRLSDMGNALVESSHKSDVFQKKKKKIFFYTCATYSELISNISTMQIPEVTLPPSSILGYWISDLHQKLEILI